MSPRRPALRRAAVASALVLTAMIVFGASPASAHGGEGQIEITSLTRQGDDVTVVAHVIYLADGHGVPDATVTVVVGDATPVVMEPGAADGDYQATVPAAEGDVIRVTSVEPAVSTEAAAPPAAETTTTSEATSASTTTTEAPATSGSTAEEEGAAASTPTPVPDAPSGGDSDRGINVVLVAVIVILVAAAVTAGILLTNRRSATEDA